MITAGLRQAYARAHRARTEIVFHTTRTDDPLRAACGMFHVDQDTVVPAAQVPQSRRCDAPACVGQWPPFEYHNQEGTP